MKHVSLKSQTDQQVYIEQIFHGKSASISSTCSLVSSGRPALASRTGRPLTGSITMRAFLRRDFLGVRTTLPLEVFTSKESPGRSPNLRRTEAGSLTCPFVETLVCMVGRSYYDLLFRRTRGAARGYPAATNFGSRTFFAVSAPRTGSDSLLSSPICLRTEA